MMPINRITRQMQDLQQAGASITRIRELLDIKSKIAGDRRTADRRIAARSAGRRV